MSNAHTDHAKEVAALVAALKGWLAFAEEELGEFDLEECESEKLCPKCESSGCINLKIRNARAALERFK